MNRIEANTKDELLQTMEALTENAEGRDMTPNPELLVLIKQMIASYANAAKPPAFTVPYSVMLIAKMLKALDTPTKGCYVLLGRGAWGITIGDSQTTQCMDPESKLSNLTAGRLGMLYGMPIYTDAYYHPEDQILPKNSLTVMSGDGSKGFAVELA